MKTISRLGILVGVATVLNFSMHSTVQAIAQSDNLIEVEVPLETALTPETGFDNNDNVQVVVHGMLPNACYTIGESKLTHQDEGRVIEIHQFAWFRNDGLCAQIEDLPIHMKMRIPFTKTVDLKRMAAGRYQIKYFQRNHAPKERTLMIAEAPVPAVDSFDYAIITNVESKDFFSSKQKPQLLIRGMLNTTCVVLDEPLQIERQGDVTVILPKTHQIPNMACAEVLVPFERVIDLEIAPVGHHLIHIRSMGGQSMNRVIEVLPQK